MKSISHSIICGDSAIVLKEFKEESIDLVVTSPPYDNLRTYKGYTFDFKRIAQELYRILKPGAVIVWIVGDATIDGDESGTSFKQALYFKEIGFNLCDTMIYMKNSVTYPSSNRYNQIFEYTFIFVKPQKRVLKSSRFNFPFAYNDSAWLASTIDGEGCFNILHSKKTDQYSSRIHVDNTNKKYVEQCKNITDVGSIYPIVQKANHQLVYEWAVSGKNVSNIIAEIYPYLIIKREQAKVILNFQKTIQNNNLPVPEKVKLQRKKYYELLKDLNQKKIKNSGFPEPDLRIIREGGPKTFNPIKDIKNRYAGETNWGKLTARERDGTLSKRKNKVIKEFGMRNNIWKYNTGAGFSAPDNLAFKHPAIFPLKLAEDHIISWSNEGDIILDPLCGSGQTLIAAEKLKRNSIGIDLAESYCELTYDRLSKAVNQTTLSYSKSKIKKENW